MKVSRPEIFLARHGETACMMSRQHTVRTEIPLVLQGDCDAVRWGWRLPRLAFARGFEPTRTGANF